MSRLPLHLSPPVTFPKSTVTLAEIRKYVAKALAMSAETHKAPPGNARIAGAE